MKLSEWEEYVKDHSKGNLTLQDSILAICEEAGEVAGWHKKSVRRKNPSHRDEHLAEELGDVLYYVTQVAHHKGWDLKLIFDMCRLKNDNKLRR